MSFSCKFYKFSKYKNSTKVPSDSAGFTYTVELKNSTSVLNPVLLLRHSDYTPEDGLYNYVYIPLFKRYYFIIDVTIDRGLWEWHCRVDSLGSWKTEIGNSSQYVLRSYSNSNEYIVDNLYPPTAVSGMITNGDSIEWASSLSSGYYVVGMITRAETASGSAVSYYVMSNTQMARLRSILMSGLDWANISIENVDEQVFKAQFNPLQYVVSCKWYPFKPPTGADVETISYGWWNISVTAATLAPTPVHVLAGSLEIPKHPQAGSRGAYLNLHPFSTYNFELRPFGFFALDSTYLADESTLYYQIRTDCLTGDSTLTLSTSSGYGNTILCAKTMLGVDIALAQLSTNYAGVVSNAVGAVASIADKDFTGAISSIGNAANAALPQLQTFNNNGSVASFSWPVRIIAKFMYPAGDSPARNGKPCCRSLVINTLSGYVLCGNPAFSAATTEYENTEIINAMAGGFYYE